MTREEFESILEEAYIEGYNTALEDIQEDILDEEAYDLEGEYDYYTESSKNVKKQMDDKLDYNATPSFTGKGEIWREYKSRNPKRNWSKFADEYNDHTGGAINGKYIKYNNDTRSNSNPRKYSSVVRGRIKSGANDSDDPRSSRLKEKAAANAERRRQELKEKLKPFRNKGNNYDE